jgi:hypothetical protein
LNRRERRHTHTERGYNTHNKKVILASLVPTHPGSASPFRTVIRLLLRAMGIRCSVSRLTRSPNGLTTLDTSLPAQCAMATPSLDRAIPRQGGIRPLTCVRQVQPAFEPARVTERRYSFPLLCYGEDWLLKVRVFDLSHHWQGLGSEFELGLWVLFLLIVRFRRPTALGYRVQDRGHVRVGAASYSDQPHGIKISLILKESDAFRIRD